MSEVFASVTESGDSRTVTFMRGDVVLTITAPITFDTTEAVEDMTMLIVNLPKMFVEVVDML